MKLKKQLSITGVLVIILIAICIPQTMYAKIYYSSIELFSGYKEMTEEEIYETKKKTETKALLTEIIELESSLPTNEDKIALLPHLLAFIERKDEFSASELIDLIKDEQTGYALESALVNMYVNKNADLSKLLSLLYDPNTSYETKTCIVSTGNYTLDELIKIFETCDDNCAVIAMKRITTLDSETAYKLAFPILFDNKEKTTSEKYIASFLGIANYLEYKRDDLKITENIKQIVVPIIEEIFNNSKDERVKDQAIYALARMNDFKIFTYIIKNENIDLELKVSSIERSINMMIEKIGSDITTEELTIISEAMKIYPIIEVGDALETSVKKGSVADSEIVTNTITYIKKYGIKGVNKYEK